VCAEIRRGEPPSVAVPEARIVELTQTSTARTLAQAPTTLSAPINTSSPVIDATNEFDTAAAGTRQQIPEYR